MSSKKLSFNQELTRLPEQVVFNIYTYLFDPRDKYLENSLRGRLKEKRYHDIDKKIRRTERKRLKHMGSFDEDVGVCDFFTLGIYMYSKEAIHVLAPEAFHLYENRVALTRSILAVRTRLRYIYEGCIRKEKPESERPSKKHMDKSFSLANFRRKIAERGDILTEFEYEGGGVAKTHMITMEIASIIRSVPPKLDTYSQRFICQGCVSEDLPNLYKYRCVWGH
jgi:hypothetical protein